MQLSDILEEQSLKNISKKTKISEENIERLVKKEFEKLERVKALGFISILEREFHADLSKLREEAIEYYTENTVEDKSSVTVRHTVMDTRRGKPKWFLWLVFGLLVYATWYFMTQYDKTHLNTLLLGENNTQSSATEQESGFITEIQQKWQDVTKQQGETSETQVAHNEMSVESAVSPVVAMEENVTIQNAVQSDESVQSAEEESIVSDELANEEEVAEVVQTHSVSITPRKKLWFGMIDIASKKREHFLIDASSELQIGEEGLLLATSSASFTLVDAGEKLSFDDAKEHYFKIDQSGITELNKDEYVDLGGWSQW